MRENIKVAIVSVIFSLIIVGCDTASSDNQTSSIINKYTPPKQDQNPDPGGNDNGNGDGDDGGQVISGGSTITSARGDTPPAPPKISQ